MWPMTENQTEVLTEDDVLGFILSGLEPLVER